MRCAPMFVLERHRLLLRSRGPDARGRAVSDMVRRGTEAMADRIFSDHAPKQPKPPHTATPYCGHGTRQPGV